MPTSFDPYHTWLGIPPEEQPPNHYRLLGITVFETNADAISNACDRQMLLLRTFQAGKHSALSQKLLNEVAAAKICLLDPDKKAVYNEQLRRNLDEQKGTEPSGPGDVEAPLFDFQPSEAQAAQLSAARRRPKLRWNSPTILAGAAGGAVIVCLVVVFALLRGPTDLADLKLEKIEPVTVNEGDVATVTARVEDADFWQGKVAYRLAPGSPKGARIDEQTGKFTWRTGASGEYRVTVRAVAEAPKADDEVTFPIRVRRKKEPSDQPAAKPPVLAAIPDQAVPAGKRISVSVDVEDPGDPGAELEFSLGPGAPPDMRINPKTGRITWQPAADSPAGEFPVTVLVASDAPGNPTAEASFAVRVSAAETAKAPVLALIPDQVVEAGEQFGFSVAVEDPGMPVAQLQFGLAPGAPEGMKIDSREGRIDWTPPEDEAAGTYPVTVLATSTAEGGLSAKKTFTIEVKARPDAGPKLAVPDEPSQTAVLVQVKELFEEEYRQTKPHARLALAARLIRHAQGSQGQPAERYVMLNEAQRLAEQSNDCLMALAAVDEMAGRFEVDGVKMKVETLEQVARKARSPAAAALIADLTFALGEEALDSDAYDSVSALYRQVEVAVRKASGAERAQVVERQQQEMAERRRLWELSQTAAAMLEGSPDSPQANLALGRFHGLAKEDWNQALPFLAKGSDNKLRESAARLVADSTDTAGQLAFADAWWESAKTETPDTGAKLLVASAARHWYQQALPRLAGLEHMRVEKRLQSDKDEPRQGAVQPYQVSLGGLGGLPALTPTKVSGAVSPGGGFATFGGKGGIEYVQVPTPSYVHEVGLTLTEPGGSMQLHYGEPREGAKISFAWDAGQEKYRCRLCTYRGGWTSWAGSRYYPPGQALQFTLYVDGSRQTLFQDGSRIMSKTSHPADLRFRASTGDGTAAVISRCLFRPWTELDAELVGCPKPPTKIDCDWSETAVRLHERNVGLSDRPVVSDGKPFVVSSTGSPMVWIPSGSFKRPHSKQPNQATEVTISNGFWIAQYEVTQGEWTTLGGANTSRVTGSPFLPVDAVSWDEAANFCKLLNQREGRPRRIPKGYQYRLPTEAEWEYACRAGSQENYSVDFDGFWSADSSQWRPHEVGEGKPNAWGVYDMHGNAIEWCYDAWQEEPATPVPQAQDPLVHPKAASDLRVLRGGAWWAPSAACSSLARLGHEPVAGGYRGFRIVLGPIIGGG